jgi:hypothetical protein
MLSLYIPLCLHAPAALPSGIQPLLPIRKEAGWAGSRTCLDEVEKRKFSTLGGLELGPLYSPESVAGHNGMVIN